jgi:hypothetical protein
MYALAFAFSDFAVDFLDFFTTSSPDALWCALSLASSSSSLDARRFGISVKDGVVDQIRGNIARRPHGSPDPPNAFHHARRPPIDTHRASLWPPPYHFNA